MDVVAPPAQAAMDSNHSDTEEEESQEREYSDETSVTINECVSEGQWLISARSEGEIAGEDIDEGLSPPPPS